MTRWTFITPTVALAALTALAACETPGGTTPNSQAATTPYRLMTINAIPYAGNATVQFNGQSLSGQTPCGAWTADREGDLPEFHISNLTSVETPCTLAVAQQEFLDGLQEVNTATFTDEGMTLSNAGGTTMEFITP